MPHWGQRVLEDKRCLPKQGAPVILLIVALAVEAKTARPRGMSGSRIETLSWPEWVKSLGLVEIGAEERRQKNARQSSSFRMPEAMNLDPLGVVAASSFWEIASVQMMGRKLWVTEEESYAEVMIFPRGAIRFAVECSSTVKDLSRRRTSSCVVQTKFAHSCDSRNATGLTSMEATDRVVWPPIVVSLCCKDHATLEKAPR